MKKVFSLVVVSMFSLSILFTACGGGEQAPEAPAEETAAPAEETAAPAVDTTAAAVDTTAAAAPAAQ